MPFKNSENETSELKTIPLRTASSNFNKALRVNFQPALVKDDVIPEVKVTNFPKEYVLPKINIGMLVNQDFNIERFDDIIDSNTSNTNDIRTFINLLHNTVQKRLVSGNANNYSLVNNLLHISKLDTKPFNIKIRSDCKLFAGDDLYETIYPELLILNQNKCPTMIVVGKHLNNVDKDFEETRIAAEILSCGDKNRRRTHEDSDQTIFAIRLISTYVTFYKAVITTPYWKELNYGLPLKHSVLIKRWPGKNGLRTGLDITDPNGRKEVLLALAKIRQFNS
ncbi:hypothetical protein RclHR1_02670002 [Rhizophagus clarus]|nr:hypothetical protein RclHR1_02670002 [Rhizophagus clarus]